LLSQTSRQEILRRINAKTGYQVVEDNLTPATRQAITNLATVQRHLFVITELLRGENSRIERSFLLRTAVKMGKDSEKTERAAQTAEIDKLQSEIDTKASDLATQILAEENARKIGQPPPEYTGSLELVQLKCPSCGATLPLPTGRFTACQYCNATLTLQDVSSQLKSMIQNI
jgi:hypothetical protein